MAFIITSSGHKGGGLEAAKGGLPSRHVSANSTVKSLLKSPGKFLHTTHCLSYILAHYELKHPFGPPSEWKGGGGVVVKL